MRRVLVVEDEDSIRELIALNLRMADYEVLEAESAEKALALLGRALPEFLKDPQGFGPAGAQIVIRDGE